LRKRVDLMVEPKLETKPVKGLPKEERENIIASFEWAFWILFVIGLLSVTNFIVANYPLAGIMILLVAGLLLLLAKSLRRKQGLPRGMA